MHTFDWYIGDVGTVVFDAKDSGGVIIDLAPLENTIYFNILDKFSTTPTVLVTKSSAEATQLVVAGDDNEEVTLKFGATDFDTVTPQWLVWSLTTKTTATSAILHKMKGYFLLQPKLHVVT